MVGSTLAAPVGVAVVLGGCALQWWNETRVVEQKAVNDKLERDTVQLGNADDAPIDPTNEGKTVYLTGSLTAPPEQTALVKDDCFSMEHKQPNSLYLERITERFLWTESKSTAEENHIGGTKEKRATFTYRKQWTAADDSGSFNRKEGHCNPPEESNLIPSRQWSACDLRIGKHWDLRCGEEEERRFLHGEATPYRGGSLSARHIEGVKGGGGRIGTGSDEWYFMGAASTNGSQRFEGNSNTPQLGDVRFKYRVCGGPLCVSLVGVQVGNSIGQKGSTWKHGGRFVMRQGTVSFQDLIKGERTTNHVVKWLLRGIGFLLQYGGTQVFLDPVVTAAVVLPFLSRLVGVATKLVSLPTAVSLSLITIAVGYLNARVTFFPVNLGFRGVWCAAVFVALRAIFTRAAAAAAAGAAAAGVAAAAVARATGRG